MSEIELRDVPAYLYERYKLEVDRRTVYNWINKGVRNERLQFTTKPVTGKRHNRYAAIRVVTAEGLEGFLHRAGIQLPLAASG